MAIAINTTSAIEAAARNHRFWFVVYLVWIPIAALVSALLTALLWRAGNLQQDATMADTNRRVAEAETKLEEQRQRTEGQRQRADEAERTLLEIQQRFTPRTLIGEQRDIFVKKLANAPKGRVKVPVIAGDVEAGNTSWAKDADVVYIRVGIKPTPDPHAAHPANK